MSNREEKEKREEVRDRSQEPRAKGQEASDKSQEASDKSQELRGKRQEARKERLEKTSNNNIVFSCVFFLLSFFLSIAANALCVMCRASLASEGNAVKEEAINHRIIYGMAMH